MTDDLRFPIGPHVPEATVSDDDLRASIGEMSALPSQMRAAARGLTDAQLDTPYRAGGWTLRQTIHHVPDSHANAYIRFKMALTEDQPTIKPYDEAAWADLSDTQTVPVDTSLELLAAVHARWVALMGLLAPEAWVTVRSSPSTSVSLASTVISTAVSSDVLAASFCATGASLTGVTVTVTVAEAVTPEASEMV